MLPFAPGCRSPDAVASTANPLNLSAGMPPNILLVRLGELSSGETTGWVQGFKPQRAGADTRRMGEPRGPSTLLRPDARATPPRRAALAL